MSHDHDHPLPSQGLAGATPFAIAVGLNLAFVVGEALWAKWAGSSALLADAVHNLGDVLGLAMAWLAMVLARRAPSALHFALRHVTVQVESAAEACACVQPCDQQVPGAVGQAQGAGS